MDTKQFKLTRSQVSKLNHLAEVTQVEVGFWVRQAIHAFLEIEYPVYVARTARIHVTKRRR